MLDDFTLSENNITVQMPSGSHIVEKTKQANVQSDNLEMESLKKD